MISDYCRMTSHTDDPGTGPPLYLVTPVIESRPMKLLTGFEVFLKLENLQPPGSFKCRGISHQCKKVSNKHPLRDSFSKLSRCSVALETCGYTAQRTFKFLEKGLVLLQVTR